MKNNSSRKKPADKTKSNAARLREVAEAVKRLNPNPTKTRKKKELHEEQ